MKSTRICLACGKTFVSLLRVQREHFDDLPPFSRGSSHQ
jgi:hypothetical protein